MTGSDVFAKLEATMAAAGPESAIAQLCDTLREQKDYANLFYAILLKKRFELGISPVPTESAGSLPEEAAQPYEDAIRDAGRLVGGLYLAEGDIPRAWAYYRMLNEPSAVTDAIDKYQPAEGEDIQPLVEIAFHQGAHPRKGFDWILSRFGICSTITMVSGTEFHQPDLKEYCIKGLIVALYEQLRQRLFDDISHREGKPPVETTVRDLIANRPYLFEDEMAYHVDVSHLSSVVQMSMQISSAKELDLARQMSAYGEHLSPRLQYPGDPPFENHYRDYSVYLAILAGDKVEEGVGHFRKKAEEADPETIGTYPAEVLVNLLLRLSRPKEALAIARRFLSKVQESRRSCPSIAELCKLTDDYSALVESSREQGDPVHFLAGLLAIRSSTTKTH